MQSFQELLNTKVSSYKIESMEKSEISDILLIQKARLNFIMYNARNVHIMYIIMYKYLSK